MRRLLPWLLVAALFAVVALLKLRTYRTLRRMRALRCPDCGRPFTVPSLIAVKRWMTFDDAGKHLVSGFYLHCDHCSADHRFRDDFTPLGRADPKP